MGLAFSRARLAVVKKKTIILLIILWDSTYRRYKQPEYILRDKRLKCVWCAFISS